MSGGTSEGNIITESPGVFAARTWISVAKVDALMLIGDADLGTIIGANWFNNVDDLLIQLNDWFNGTGVAPHIRATTLTATTLNIDDVVAVDDVIAGDRLVGAFAEIGGTVKADAIADADNVTVGATGSNNGITVFGDVGRLVFSDGAGLSPGAVVYTHSTDVLALRAGATNVAEVSATDVRPSADNTYALGTGSRRWSDLRTVLGTVTTTLQVGDNNAPTLTIDRAAGSSGLLEFAVNGTTQWYWRNASDNLYLDRYSGGVYADSVEFDNSTGRMSAPGDVAVGNDFTVSGSQVALEDSNVELMLGDGNGNVRMIMYGVNAQTYQLQTIAVTGDLALIRYSSGVAQEALYFYQNGDGMKFVGGSFGVSATNCGISIAKGGGGEGALQFISDSVNRFALTLDSSENLVLRAYDAGGSLSRTTTFNNSTGEISHPANLTLTASAAFLTLGDGSGSPTVRFTKSSGGGQMSTIDFTDAGTTRWGIRHNSSADLEFRRHNAAGTLQDTTTVSGTNGEWLFPKGIGISGQTRRFTAGTGVPAGGTNGDLYWRVDGTASTCLYYRVGGVWTALAT